MGTQKWGIVGGLTVQQWGAGEGNRVGLGEGLPAGAVRLCGDRRQCGCSESGVGWEVESGSWCGEGCGVNKTGQAG